jgi:hypothetical protein
MPLILDTLDVQALATFRASSSSLPSLRVPHGIAPTSPTNGDIWTTTAGIFIRVIGTLFEYIRFAGQRWFRHHWLVYRGSWRRYYTDHERGPIWVDWRWTDPVSHSSCRSA